MMARVRKSLDENQKGFTLVELLVVVIIIGILAAIAVPVYLGQQGKAKESGAKADLANAKTALVVKLVEAPTTNFSTPVAFSTAVTGFTKSEHTTSLTIESFSNSAATFCIEAVANGVTYSTTDSTGIAKAACP